MSQSTLVVSVALAVCTTLAGCGGDGEGESGAVASASASATAEPGVRAALESCDELYFPNSERTGLLPVVLPEPDRGLDRSQTAAEEDDKFVPVFEAWKDYADAKSGLTEIGGEEGTRQSKALEEANDELERQCMRVPGLKQFITGRP